jgi:hypothetical protein
LHDLGGVVMSGLFDTFAGGGGPAKYSIGHSVRLRASVAPRLYRARTTSSTNALSSRSIWFKRGLLDGNRMLAFGWYDANNYTYFSINADKLYFSTTIAGTAYSVSAPPLLRDPSAHYHVVLRVDTAQAVAANRVIIEINGVLQTLTGTFPPQGFGNTLGNNGSDQWIGINQALAAANAFDGYLSKYEYVIGATPAASAFGEQDANGIWVPKEYTGSYGTSGFYLDFSDGSSLAALTADKSGNGINWTASNISLTAGVTYDWMNDTPTNNYCTLNPLDNTTGTFYSANLNYSQAAAGDVNRCTFAPTTGKWYWEAEYTAAASTDGSALIGVMAADIARISSTSVATLTGGAWGYRDDGLTITGGTSTAGFTNYATGAKIMVALDLDNQKLWWGYNGTWEKSGAVGDPTAGTNPAYSLGYTGRPIAPFFGFQSATGNESWDANFGQRPFAYTPPTGFKALCTANLPAVAITNPRKHFDVAKWAGDGTTGRVISSDGNGNSLQLPVSLVWNKIRSKSGNHQLTDIVRGTQKRLISNTTDVEITVSGSYGVTAFGANSFTIGDNVNGDNGYNGTSGGTYGGDYVGWLWAAGGAAVTNNAGSISSQVSANPTAGFSVVTYTGTGANATVGHGLGVPPKMIITKNRVNAGRSWAVFHQNGNATPQNGGLFLNGTGAWGADSALWNNTAPASTVYSIGITGHTNESGQAQVAYCFAEIPGYSKFGSYVGNGSTDGPFVWCGFRPKYVMFKNASAVGDWNIHDASRCPDNLNNLRLYADLASAEATNGAVDLLSNGFKIRGNVTDTNGNGNTIVFAAFAEYPFGGSNVSPSPAR